MIRPIDDAMGQGMGSNERRAIAHQRIVRHIIIMLGLHQQHIACEFGASCQGAIVGWAQNPLAIVVQALAVQGLLGVPQSSSQYNAGTRKASHLTGR